jgi:GT2 family glycosyltransferase
MPRKAQVCTVVLNWNRPQDTLECLDSLFPLVRNHQTKLIVCDNHSTDESIAKICSWAALRFQCIDPDNPLLDHSNIAAVNWDFLLIRNHENRGYGGGNNPALRIALNQLECEYVWVLNNDCVVDEKALTALISCATAHQGAGVVGATLIDYADRARVQCAGGCRYNPLTTIFSPLLGGVSLSQSLTTPHDPGRDYISGASLFFRATALRHVGLFDERFFLYYEELDMARRLRAAGYSDWWCRSAWIYHKGGMSTGAFSGKNNGGSWLSNYHENLSTLLFTRKYHRRLFALAALLRFMGKSATYLIHRRFHLFSALVRAYWDAITGSRFQPVSPNANTERVFLGCLLSQ